MYTFNFLNTKATNKRKKEPMSINSFDLFNKQTINILNSFNLSNLNSYKFQNKTW